MDSSAASYANDQLGNGWNSFIQLERPSNRIAHTSRSRRSISHLLGGTHIYGTESQSRPVDLAGILSSFSADQASIRTAENDDYLKSLITDNEIEQIRSENQDLLNGLMSVYVFEVATKVLPFLEDHPSVPHFLLEAVPFLRKSFGDSVILQLQIPPDEDVPLTIYAVALWDGAVEDATAALRKFDDSWWTANGHRASGKIVIDYQLV
jgi:hypothetical protein